MTDGSHEHNPATDPPGAQSNQNGEEAQSAHREDGTHPEPRTAGKPARERPAAEDEGGGSDAGASRGSNAGAGGGSDAGAGGGSDAGPGGLPTGSERAGR